MRVWVGMLSLLLTIHEFDTITEESHHPAVHHTLSAQFCVCSFCPRYLIISPCDPPYNHSNIDSDEVYYVAAIL